jgi:hypothetical protein
MIGATIRRSSRASHEIRRVVEGKKENVANRLAALWVGHTQDRGRTAAAKRRTRSKVNMTAAKVDMEKIVAQCKRRGFIFQSSETYGGIGEFWDYGLLGCELKMTALDRRFARRLLQRARRWRAQPPRKRGHRAS